ncbi:unnamed protein product [Ilex paraguariensis]|uniref:Fungal-type protein kinase domain-containing protein n=1 Tax=Ilex paraguariensis TaxID=185542 RepID=A0ABC8RGD8_9AQUA
MAQHPEQVEQTTSTFTMVPQMTFMVSSFAEAMLIPVTVRPVSPKREKRLEDNASRIKQRLYGTTCACYATVISIFFGRNETLPRVFMWNINGNLTLGSSDPENSGMRFFITSLIYNTRPANKMYIPDELPLENVGIGMEWYSVLEI